MNITRETFDKSERLCSRKVIEKLFETGNVFYTPLFKVVWEAGNYPFTGPAQVAFSVSKRGFRLAVTRNLIKRRLRETYRRNKALLYNHLLSENIQIVFVVIIRGNSVPDFATVEKGVKEVISKLINLNIQKQKNPPQI
jgi:ribonuclease P protein component